MKTERLPRTIRWLQVYAALMTVALIVLFVRIETASTVCSRHAG